MVIYCFIFFDLPPQLCYKLNFDDAVFSAPDSSRYGAMIKNHNGEVMTTFSLKGVAATESFEAKLMACHRALEFSV